MVVLVNSPISVLNIVFGLFVYLSMGYSGLHKMIKMLRKNPLLVVILIISVLMPAMI